MFVSRAAARRRLRRRRIIRELARNLREAMDRRIINMIHYGVPEPDEIVSYTSTPKATTADMVDAMALTFSQLRR